MNLEELFGKSTAAGSKEGASNVSQKPKISSPIINVANLAFSQARNQDSGVSSNLSDKSPVIHSRTLSDTLSEGFRGIKSSTPEAAESSNQSGSSESSSEETESSDSSITRVELVKPKVKASSVVGSEVKSVTDGQEANTDADLKKARAKVSSNMIISDFSSLKFPQKKQQEPCEDWLEDFPEKRDNRSEVSRSSDPGRSNAHKVKTSENTLKTRQRRTNSISDDFPRKVSFDSNYDATLKHDIRSDVLWGNDPSQRKSILKQNTLDNQSNYGSTSYHNDDNEWSNSTSNMPKAKASSLISYNNTSPHFQNNGKYRLNPRYNNKTPPDTPKTWSDVVYRPKEVKTDAGPTGQQRRFARIPTSIEENNILFPSYQNPSRRDLKHKPKVSMNAMMDVTNIHSGNFRGVSPSAQIDAEYDDEYGADDGYYDDEEPIEEVEEEEGDDGDDDDNDREEMEELMSLSSDPKVRRKFLDLRISNKSLLSLNANLDATVKDQSMKLANLPSFESIASTQQQQLDHILKVEKLMDVLTKKMSEQESEIKDLKDKLDEATEENQKVRVNLFYDPKTLPLNSLPRLIFERVHDDITVFFAVITSLIYTIYVFPVVVMAKSAQTLADKSRAKIHELSG